MSDFDQKSALDPAHSVVIEACAGSGKTWLLVSRIVRLLLAGVPPSEILAITFTRKAAQEMAGRLRDWLSLLAQAPDDEVRSFLRQRALSEAEVEALLPRARSLFEQFLTAQPGITINTFHGWFLQLLQRAPLDSGAVGAAGLLEQVSPLLEEAWQSFAEELQGKEESEEAQALNTLFRDCGLSSTRDLLLNFVSKRAEWWAYIQDAADPVSFALAQLAQELEVEPDADLVAELFSDPGVVADLSAYASLLEANTATDKKSAAALVAAIASGDNQKWFKVSCVALFTNEGPPRIRNSSDAQAKRLGEAGQQRLLSLHAALCERLGEVRDALTEQAAYHFNAAALRCGAALLGHYQRLKEARSAIDFTDVEWRVHRLLTHSDHAAFMQYKLDSRYRHILLDEFQDTNPLQWQVLRAWLDASASADLKPTVFLVGDPKQSIYRFRRAEPRLFQIAAEFLQQEYGAVCLSQNMSRRSAPAVLQAVNQVFAAEAGFTGFHPHASHHPQLPGHVEVLPLPEVANEQPAAEPSRLTLRNPLQQPLPDAEDQRHAKEGQQLADKIHAIVGNWVVTGDDGSQRPAQLRDIMILVRSRTHLAAYEQALKAAHIHYVSARQGGLLDTLEASNITALLQFLITPFADLYLAQVLRSPLFACSDEDLMALASLPGVIEEKASNWWRRLQQLATTGAASTRLQRAHELLQSWQKQTDMLPVHDLLDRIYFEGNLQQRYAQAVPDAMRPSVLANLQAFMDLALNVEGGRYPSLPKFLNELAALRRVATQEAPDEGVITPTHSPGDKGDVSNALRIYTVHGSKGLEAPIVWLLNSHAAQKKEDSYGVLLDWQPEEPTPSHFSLYTTKKERGKKREDYFDAEAAFAAREDLNLLYVAMTRAKQALIVSGCANSRAADSWYERIARALGETDPSPTASTEMMPTLPFKGEAGVGMGSNSTGTPPIPHPASPLKGEEENPNPALTQPLPTGKRERTAVSAARQYGISLHALLEHIAPPRPLPDKAALQSRLGIATEGFDELWQAAVSLIEAPQLARFFDPTQYLHAYNELPYATATGESRRIDRLVEFEDSVWILDYKTSEKAEASNLAQMAKPYHAQLQEYRAAMQTIFPHKPIRCALAFGGGLLYEMP
jgi:ATP-dependent helicase/nuclease subunit A